MTADIQVVESVLVARTNRIRACPRDEDLARFIVIEVKDEESLVKVADRLASPILDCDPKGFDLVLDARDKIAYELKKQT